MESRALNEEQLEWQATHRCPGRSSSSLPYARCIPWPQHLCTSTQPGRPRRSGASAAFESEMTLESVGIRGPWEVGI